MERSPETLCARYWWGAYLIDLEPLCGGQTSRIRPFGKCVKALADAKAVEPPRIRYFDLVSMYFLTALIAMPPPGTKIPTASAPMSNRNA